MSWVERFSEFNYNELQKGQLELPFRHTSFIQVLKASLWIL